MDCMRAVKIKLIYVIKINVDSSKTDVGAAENAAAAAWGRISLGGGGVSAAGTNFLAT